jgi:transposase
MKQAKYIVKLTEGERVKLESMLNKGTHPAQQVKRARVLLALDRMSYYQNRPKRKYMPTLEGITAQYGVSSSMIYAVSKRFIENGLEATIAGKKRETPPIEPIVTGDVEARIIALACGNPPEGYSRWTLRLLESKTVELGIVDHISDTTLYRVLKKQNLNLI